MLAMNFGDSSSDAGSSLLNIMTTAFAPAGQAAQQTQSQAVTGITALNQVAATPSQAQPQSTSWLTTVGQFVGGVIKGAMSSTSTPTPTSPVAPTYPAGAVTAYDPSQARWRVAVPGAAGLGVADARGRCMVGSCGGGLGASFHEVAPAAVQPSGVAVVDLKTFLKDIGQGPWYTKPWVWAAIGGGAAVVGGTYLVVRKRRAS